MEEEFVGTSDTSIIGNLVWTGLQATRVLRTLSRHADADAVTDSLVKRFDHLSARVIKQGLGWSLAEQSETHESVDDFERATNHCAQFIEQWGNSDRQPDVFEDLIAWVYAQRAYYFRGAKRYDEAIAVCNDVDERFGSSTNIEVQVEVARALLQKVVALRHSKRLSACSTAAKALLRRFADATDKRIIAQRRWAIYAQGFALAHEAKLFRQNGLHEDSVLKLELALQCFSEAAEQDPNEPEHLGAKAYTEFLLGRTAEAEQTFVKALSVASSEWPDIEAWRFELSLFPSGEDTEFMAAMEHWAQNRATYASGQG